MISGQIVANVVEGYMVKVFDLLALLPLIPTDEAINIIFINKFGRYKIDKMDRKENLITLKQPNDNQEMEIKENINIMLN